MSPGVQSRDDTRVPDGHKERDLDCISAGESSSAFGLPRWIGIELLCRRPVKRKRALLGSNPPRNSRLETHCDEPGADRTGSAPATWRLPSHHLFSSSIVVDLPIPQKPTLATA